jgi:hypothetical protein
MDGNPAQDARRLLIPAASMPPLPNDSPGPEANGYPSSTVRSIASLVLFIHLFCLFVALTSNYYLSPLQIALLNAVAPYVQLVKLKPTAPYHLTDSTELGDDHFIEVEVVAGSQTGQIIRFPEGNVGASPAGRRAEIFASTIAATAYLGAEPNTAALSKAAGARVLDAGDNDEVIVRIKRFQPQQRVLDSTNPATPADPTAPEYVGATYQARVWRDRMGQVQLLKIEESKVVAPLE